VAFFPVSFSVFTSVWISLPALLLALAVDRWGGEPPARLHPVVWMGNYLGWAGKQLQRVACQDRACANQEEPDFTPDFKAFWLGALAWTVVAAIVLIVAWALQMLAAALPGVLAVLLLGLLLKPLLAWAMLRSEVLAVEKALAPEHGGSLAAGRERLRWLVSRDVAALSESGVRESAIESLAENLNDSVVAPIFWFVLLGLPGAALYRFANTADAMWGYRGVYQGRNWEWAGKWAARADDILSWVPARITGLLLLVVSGANAGGRGLGHGLAALRLEAPRTPSPNSGWPMAAMALALDVCLHKPGVYALNASGRPPQAHDTQRAIAYAAKVLLALVVIAQAAIILVAIGARP
jgi:adenosylcobinamide-phosphate synthase